jgi:hypothetical protein
MAHISSVGAGIFTTLNLNKASTAAVPGTGIARLDEYIHYSTKLSFCE